MERIFELWDSETREAIEVKARYSSDGEYKGICPKHNDHNPSLFINSQNGVFHCFGCGWEGKVMNGGTESLSQKAKEYLNEKGHDYTPKTISHFNLKSSKKGDKEYIWYNYQGVSRYIRVETKESKWWSKKGDKIKLIGDLSNPQVLLCEGEHDMFMAYQKGLKGYATFTGGAQSLPQQEELLKLKDKEVVIIYDRDDAGKKGARKVVKALLPITKEVRIVELQLKEGKDLTDFFNQRHTKEELLDLINKTSVIKEKSLDSRIEVPTSFKELEDGTLIEEVYNSKEFMLAVFKDGEVKYADSYKISEEEILKPVEIQPIIAGALKLPEEATEYVDDKKLIEEVRNFIHNYVELDPFGELLATYYVFFSWVYDKFSEVPYLRFLGDYGTGKSRALKTIGGLCYKVAIFAASSSIPSLFRTAQIFRSSIYIDEADFSVSDLWADIIKFLNSRMDKTSYIWRAEENSKDGYKPYAFCLFGPTLLGTRRKFKDEALESRCITIQMKERKRKEIPINLPDEFYEEQQNLRNKLLLWRLRNYYNTTIKPDEIDGVEPRMNQIAIPLLSIIKDSNAKRELSNFIKRYQEEIRESRSGSLKAEVLIAIDRVFQKIKEMREQGMILSSKEDKAEHLSYKKIIEEFNNDKSEGEKLKEQRLGYLLRELGFRKDTYGRKAYLPDSEENLELLESLKEKYGLSETIQTTQTTQNE